MSPGIVDRSYAPMPTRSPSPEGCVEYPALCFEDHGCRRSVLPERPDDQADRHDNADLAGHGPRPARQEFGFLAGEATAEAERTSERVARAKEEAAKHGKYRGGPRPFGFRRDGVTIRKDEAEVIRQTSAAILAGRTLASVARELNEDGITTSTGKPWTYARLRDVLIRPRNAGLLSKGRADRGEAEVIGRAKWPAIIDEETWRALDTLLIDLARRKQNGNEPRWLGSGLYLCSRCGGSMRCTAIGGADSRRGGSRRYYYRCVAQNHLMVRQDSTDSYIRDVVAEMVRDPRVMEALTPRNDNGAFEADRLRRNVLATRLEKFERDYASDLITGPQLKKATEAVTKELREVDERMATARRHSTASPIAGAVDPGKAFLNAPVDVQRAVLAAVLKVEVLPSARRGVAWSPNRLRLIPAANPTTSP
jgi:site-specific DNA recombinase